MPRGCQCDGSATLCPRCQYFADYAAPTPPQRPAARLTAPAPPTQARPRGPQPYRSKTEARFAALCRVWQYEQMGVAQWWYEPCKGLHLTDTMSYTPDFLLALTPAWAALPFAALLPPDSPCVWIEVKGAFMREQDWLKAKMAAATFPLWPFVRAQWAQHTWHYLRIPAH